VLSRKVTYPRLPTPQQCRIRASATDAVALPLRESGIRFCACPVSTASPARDSPAVRAGKPACALDGSQRPEMTAFVRQSRSPTTNQPAIAFYGSLGATWTPKTSPWPPLTHGEAFGRPVKFLGGTRPKLVPEIARGRESLYNAHK
jgi:hypothetical protein